ECQRACAHKITTQPAPLVEQKDHVKTTSRTLGATTFPMSILNDAPGTTQFRRLSSASVSVANKLAFRSDLDRQLANEKRRLENRADLAYSSLVDHPVTVACTFLPFFFIVW
ncbi:unnamed protein product, partial [Haemonchus placei]|uniref:PHM7_ext domain-containing protein n=1 Tax=Haemonchus placei TaxID=6290 RepID=A0A0N4W096_HAEPC